MIKNILLILTLLLSTNFVLADTLKFAQVTDVHIHKVGYISKHGKDLSKSQETLRQTVRTLNDDNSIQYVFFTGDDVDMSYDYLWAKFFDIVNYLNKPYYLCLGNHDSNSSDGLNKSEVLEYIQKRSKFHQTSPNFVVELNDKFVAVMFDATLDDERKSIGYVKEETLTWLDNVLYENKDKYVILFDHFPVVEPKNKNRIKTPIRIANKKQLVKLIKKHKNIVAFVSGHCHKTGEFKKYGIIHYSTPALFKEPNYYRIIEIDYDKKINSIKSEIKSVN